jgi:hypothetical protein
MTADGRSGFICGIDVIRVIAAKNILNARPYL